MEPVEVKDGNVLLCLDVETEFPAGTGWMIAEFFLTDKANKSAVEKHFPTIGFTVPTKNVPLYFYRTEKGAAAFLSDNNEVLILDSPLGKRGQLYFGFVKNPWPGGAATVWLLFQVPKDQRNLELVTR